MNYCTNFWNATTAFEFNYDYIMDNGLELNDTRCMYNASFSIMDPTISTIHTSWRKFNKDYAQKEWLWYLSGDRNATKIAESAKLWKKMMNDKGEVNSNYGYHWKKNDQLNRIIEMLGNDPTTRKAVILHYDYNDVANYTLDTPCNIALHFQIVNNKLNLTIFARSIDLVYGFCNDHYCFSKLQSLVANDLNIPCGSSHWFISNLHIYEKHFNLKNNNIK